MKFFCLKPVVAGEWKQLILILLTCSLPYSLPPTLLLHSPLALPNPEPPVPHTHPLHCKCTGLIPCPASNWAEGKRVSTRSCS